MHGGSREVDAVRRPASAPAEHHICKAGSTPTGCSAEAAGSSLPELIKRGAMEFFVRCHQHGFIVRCIGEWLSIPVGNDTSRAKHNRHLGQDVVVENIALQKQVDPAKRQQARRVAVM